MKVVLNDTNKELVDKVIKYGGKHVYECFQCGMCASGCPVASDTDHKIKRTMHQVLLGLDDQILEKKAIWLCTTCFMCLERCPQNAGPTEVVFALRRISAERGIVPEAQIEVANNIYHLGHAVTIQKGIKLRDKVDAPELKTAASDKKYIDEIQKLIDSTHAVKLLKIRKDWKPKGDDVIACD
ncbi:MAG: hydrogenase MvhADGHdrABC CoB-CoM heterodisulfide reductase subunit C [Candidatus Methanofastidiosum methylothiophilum]|uniref:Hydrogenase MvhADGHdrABC CoB-CoM heterodisulfide reductase subunit C n=1 Tax=Candidatus Methanofastidiosum methylothiophilum TaxID=1705564 RepID=A0A150IQF7_9EURY|nr:MAG: hydrogenase MvhADGHdrABC CoB-CoM heterodisulfide reductase subunit C [Candidatus Methanofastidiosum methylthiophilus]NMC76839.1 4Fe-4S dicluster domain-containing protein [Candidatus Methanofastidiosa archaeon]